MPGGCVLLAGTVMAAFCPVVLAQGTTWAAATGVQPALWAQVTLPSNGADFGAGASPQPDPAPMAAPQTQAETNRDDLFAGTEKFAKGASDVTEVNMDPDSLELVGGSQAAKAHRMVLNVVRTYEYPHPGMYNPADVEEYRHKLESGDWHCSVHMREERSGESTDVCNRRHAPDMIETAIITVEPKELTFIHTIRKAGHDGSRITPTSLPALGFGAGLPMTSMLSAISPEIQAEVAAEQAETRASVQAMESNPELQEELAEARAETPRLQAEMQELRMEQPELNSEHWTEQMRKLGEQMRQFRSQDFAKQSSEMARERERMQEQMRSLQKQLNSTHPAPSH